MDTRISIAFLSTTMVICVAVVVRGRGNQNPGWGFNWDDVFPLLKPGVSFTKKERIGFE
jgi:hypothetical protein